MNDRLAKEIVTQAFEEFRNQMNSLESQGQSFASYIICPSPFRAFCGVRGSVCVIKISIP